MNEKEKIIVGYMKNLQISREEAEQLFLDDDNDFIGEEGEKMQASAKQFQHREKSDKPRTVNKPKKRKIDDDKKYLFDCVRTLLRGLNGVENLSHTNEVDLTFTYKDSVYTWKLTKHRPPK